MQTMDAQQTVIVAVPASKITGGSVKCHDTAVMTKADAWRIVPIPNLTYLERQGQTHLRSRRYLPPASRHQAFVSNPTSNVRSECSSGLVETVCLAEDGVTERVLMLMSSKVHDQETIRDSLAA